MSYIIFNNDLETKYKDVSVSLRDTQSGTGKAVEIMFPAGIEAVINTSGFKMYTNNGKLFRDFSSFRTIYRTNYIDIADADTSGYMLSDDETVWVEPTPVPPAVKFVAAIGGSLDGELTQTVNDFSELVVPTATAEENYEFAAWNPEIPESGTVEEDVTYTATFNYIEPIGTVITNKVTELNAIQQTVIDGGTDVALSIGTQHFTATSNDQTSLLGLSAMIQQGMTQIPWHCSDHSKGCQFYSPADALLIINGISNFVTYQVTYFRDLRRYVESLTDRDEVAAATYGMDIPEEFQSDVLKALLAAQVAAAGTTEESTDTADSASEDTNTEEETPVTEATEESTDNTDTEEETPAADTTEESNDVDDTDTEEESTTEE